MKNLSLIRFSHLLSYITIIGVTLVSYLLNYPAALAIEIGTGVLIFLLYNAIRNRKPSQSIDNGDNQAMIKLYNRKGLAYKGIAALAFMNILRSFIAEAQLNLSLNIVNSLVISVITVWFILWLYFALDKIFTAPDSALIAINMLLYGGQAITLLYFILIHEANKVNLLISSLVIIALNWHILKSPTSLHGIKSLYRAITILSIALWFVMFGDCGIDNLLNNNILLHLLIVLDIILLLIVIKSGTHFNKDIFFAALSINSVISVVALSSFYWLDIMSLSDLQLMGIKVLPYIILPVTYYLSFRSTFYLVFISASAAMWALFAQFYHLAYLITGGLIAYFVARQIKFSFSKSILFKWIIIGSLFLILYCEIYPSILPCNLSSISFPKDDLFSGSLYFVLYAIAIKRIVDSFYDSDAVLGSNQTLANLEYRLNIDRVKFAFYICYMILFFYNYFLTEPLILLSYLLCFTIFNMLPNEE